MRRFDRIETERLILRRWRTSDLVPFAAMNADPDVMEFFVSLHTPDESDAMADRIEAGFEEHGWGLWAAQVPGVADFIGFIGLSLQTFPAHFTPAVEVGWRLAKEHWGHGYAPEGAAAALELAFGPAGLDEVVSTTTVRNARSRRVMEKLRMTHDPADDFEHAKVPEGNPLRPHVLYRARRATWTSPS